MVLINNKSVIGVLFKKLEDAIVTESLSFIIESSLFLFSINHYNFAIKSGEL
jgi:hypothetical protein